MSVDTIWQEFLKIVDAEVGSRVVETWFKAVQLVQWDAYRKIAYLEAPNSFVRQWLEKHYKGLLCVHLGRLLNEEKITVTLTEANRLSDKNPQSPSQSRQRPPLHESAENRSVQIYEPATKVPQRTSSRIRGALNQHYVFDSFVAGPSNRLAFSAVQAAAEHLGSLYNPLFIYGESGLGKTHLLHAMGNYVHAHNSEASILYQPADRFVNEFINAIRFNKVYQFEAKYRDIDLLLVDDIQFISNKEQTQEAFFHIFNMLYQSNKQVVVTSDVMPRDIAGLAERMRSRLEGGLIADVQMPSLETQIAILQKKATLHSKFLPYDAAHFIASHQFANIRELEGALIRVMAFSSLTHQSVTCELVKQVLYYRQQKRHTNQSPTLMCIAKVVSQSYQCKVSVLQSSARNRDVAYARHVAMYLMKKITDSSLREIASFFKRKDHSTVIHAFEKIDHLRSHDAEFNQLLSDLERRCCISSESSH